MRHDDAKTEYRAALAAFNALAKPTTLAKLLADDTFRTAQKRVAKAINNMRALGIR